MSIYFSHSDQEVFNKICQLLQNVEGFEAQDQYCSIVCDHDLSAVWPQASAAVQDIDGITVAIAAGKLSPGDVMTYMQPFGEACKVADNFWLHDALVKDSIAPVFQSVVDRSGQIYGYEAFARIGSDEDAKMISGYEIMHAADVLNIKYNLDKHLHAVAIRDFSEKRLFGRLFINVVPSFVQRIDKYLEGLKAALNQYDIIPRRIVLDIVESESIYDINKIKDIVEFCNDNGFSVSLDDVTTPFFVNSVLEKTRVEYLKVDSSLTKYLPNPTAVKTISKIVELAHSRGCAVVGEGVESKNNHKTLKDIGLDLFQGHYFKR